MRLGGTGDENHAEPAVPNQAPEGAKRLPGGMCSQDLFVEVGHGPTLIDNNILLSDVSLRFATEGVAMVQISSAEPLRSWEAGQMRSWTVC